MNTKPVLNLTLEVKRASFALILNTKIKDMDLEHFNPEIKMIFINVNGKTAEIIAILICSKLIAPYPNKKCLDY